MKLFFYGSAFAVLLLMPNVVHAEVVYDATQPHQPYWAGFWSYEEIGDVIRLGGTARVLESVTIDSFYHTPGEFTLTASIYATPSTINGGDVITGSPLWTSTVKTNLANEGYDNIVFTGSKFVLPDTFALIYSFHADEGKGTGGLTWQMINADDPYNFPRVGSLASDYGYVGLGDYLYIPDWEANWWPYDPEDTVLYARGQINASVPGPLALLPFGIGIATSLLSRRRRNR